MPQSSTYILFLGFLAAGLAGQAQEITSPLKGNPVLISASNVAGTATTRTISSVRDTLCLPFFDDFSNPRYWLDSTESACGDTVYRNNADFYPTNLLWTDSGAFVNSTYPLNPPSYGVATLDGLNKFGRPYSEGSPYGPADTMSSRPIRLGGGFVDSLYLSFYYQAGGLGEAPNTQDSLLLEFYKADSTWSRVWFSLGLTGPTTEDSFKLVTVPLADPSYWHDGFRFRFRNYATRSGNNDHWNIDYVYLDDNRTFDDTLFRDVGFVVQPESLLKRYRQMPWRQFVDFESTEFGSPLEIEVRNNFNTVLNTSFRNTMSETYTQTVLNGPSIPVADGVPAFGGYLFDYPNDPIPLSAPNYDKDSMSVNVMYELGTTADFAPFNDTIRHQQDFFNYFAYDDGSAERAYGLFGTGGQFAYRYETNEPDTIYAFLVHFAYVEGALPSLFFSLTVWDQIDTTLASDGQNEIYREDFKTPQYVDSLNGFYVYRLEEPVPVNGIFYIGWLQTQSDLLNFGFDRNSDARNQSFFRIGGNWQRSALQGAVMIRPQMGPDYAKYPAVGIAPEAAAGNLRLFPNPSIGWLKIEGPAWVDRAQIRVFGTDGRMLKPMQSSGGLLDVSALPVGLYLLEVLDLDGMHREVLRFFRE